MDNIQELEKIGLRKVCQETHIEEKYLIYMVQSDFDKLEYINTLGFIKILSREYNLDLSEWEEGFKEYWEQNRKEEGDDGFIIIAEDKKNRNKFFVFILLILFGAAFYVLFSVFQDKINIANYANTEETAYEQPAIVKEAQEALDEVNSSDEAMEEELLIEDINNSEDAVVQDTVEKETIVEEETIAENETIEEEETLEEQKETTIINSSLEAVLVPNTRLWIGVIYLDDKSRESFIGEGNFTIDLSREQIISTGHGSFTLLVDGQKREFDNQVPVRLLVKDTNITQISIDEFKELNEGKIW